MDAAEHGILIPDELPGQLAFFSDDAVEKASGKPQKHASQIYAPDLSHPPLICILLCDILSQMGGTLPADWLYDITVSAGHINHFLYSDVTGFLIENEMVQEQTEPDGSTKFVLLEKGRQCAKILRLYVPKLYRDRVLLTALRYRARKKAERDLRITYEKTPPDWTACIRCYDQRREMFSLQIHAPTQADAESLGERILCNPSGFFGKVLHMILTNEEEQYDLTDN